MKKLQNLGIIAVFSIFLYSCSALEDVAPKSLTEAEIVEGLKTALKLGTDTAVTVLHKPDGFLMDAAVKILLPPEAKVISDNVNTISQVPLVGETAAKELKGLLGDVVTCMNRSAEDAAIEAKPIFVNAITDLSIEQALNILNGQSTGSRKEFDSIAATSYLKKKTYPNLQGLFQSKIDVSLNKPLVGNYSTNQVWGSLTEKYNLAAPWIGAASVNTSLSGYVTGKALDGVFFKVGVEEKQIRKSPLDWASDIIHKVFGSVKGKK